MLYSIWPRIPRGDWIVWLVWDHLVYVAWFRGWLVVGDDAALLNRREYLEMRDRTCFPSVA